MRFSPEEKLEIIQLARYSGLGFEKTLRLFGLKPSRIWLWIRKIEKEGLGGLIDKPPMPKTLSLKHTSEEENLILEKANLYTQLNHRKLAHQIFRDEGIFVSESLVYRILKEHDFIHSMSYSKIEPSDSWRSQPHSPNEIWHIDISYISCGLINQGKTIFWYLIAVLVGYSLIIIRGFFSNLFCIFVNSLFTLFLSAPPVSNIKFVNGIFVNAASSLNPTIFSSNSNV